MKPRPKVLHLIQSLDNGGCENQLLRLLPLCQNGDHVVVTLRNRGELATAFEAKGVPVVCVKQSSLLDVASYWRLRQAIQVAKPDIILTYLLHADIVGRLIVAPLWRYRVIPWLRTTYNFPRYRWARAFEWLTRPLVGHYLANSPAVKNFYIERLGVVPTKITVIPNGIDVSQFGRSRRGLKKDLGIDDGALVITCVANLHSNKGHHYLLEAFDQFWRRHPRSWLLLVGSGEAAPALRRQSESLAAKDRILWLGLRADVPDLLALTDIFVLPTLFEGMSNALLEAAASGVAIITTDIPENRHTLKHARFVPIRDGRAITIALRGLARNASQRRELGQSGYNEVKESYSIAKVASCFETYLLSLTSTQKQS